MRSSEETLRKPNVVHGCVDGNPAQTSVGSVFPTSCPIVRKGWLLRQGCTESLTGNKLCLGGLRVLGKPGKPTAWSHLIDSGCWSNHRSPSCRRKAARLTLLLQTALESKKNFSCGDHIALLDCQHKPNGGQTKWSKLFEEAEKMGTKYIFSKGLKSWVCLLPVQLNPSVPNPQHSLQRPHKTVRKGKVTFGQP